MAMTDDLLTAVDRLTKPTNRRLWREDGSSDRVEVPSLLDQLEDSIGQGSEQMGSGTFASRLPISVDIRDTLADWRDSVRGELLSCGVTPHPDSGLRGWLLQVAVCAPPAPYRAPDLDRWAVQVGRWVRRAEELLGLHDDEASPRRLRDTNCPRCQASHVRTDEQGRVIPAGARPHGEVRRVPVLLVRFADGGVYRSIECSACGATWFGQSGMWQLGEALYGRSREVRSA